MAGQKLAHAVCAKSHHSVSPFPHDGSNLAALNDALQGKRNKLGSEGSSDLLKQTQKSADKGSQGEGEMNLQGHDRTASKDNKGTKQAYARATSLSPCVLLPLS